jgi:hypothetical protein
VVETVSQSLESRATHGPLRLKRILAVIWLLLPSLAALQAVGKEHLTGHFNFER